MDRQGQVTGVNGEHARVYIGRGEGGARDLDPSLDHLHRCALTDHVFHLWIIVQSSLSSLLDYRVTRVTRVLHPASLTDPLDDQDEMFLICFSLYVYHSFRNP